jgi:hypothetical protein
MHARLDIFGEKIAAFAQLRGSNDHAVRLARRPRCSRSSGTDQTFLYCICEHFVIHINRVKTLVLRIPDELEIQLEVLASRRGKTKSAIAREVLSRGVRRRPADDLSVFDLMRDQIGIIETAVGDLASNPKHLEGFGR